MPTCGGFGSCSCFAGPTGEWYFQVKYRFPQGAGSPDVEAFDFINCAPSTPLPTVSGWSYLWPNSGIITTKSVDFPFYVGRITIKRDPPATELWTPGNNPPRDVVHFVAGAQSGFTTGGVYIDDCFAPTQAFNPTLNFGDANPIDLLQPIGFNPDGSLINPAIPAFGYYKGGLVSSVSDSDPIFGTAVAWRDFWIPPGTVLTVTGYVVRDPFTI